MDNPKTITGLPDIEDINKAIYKINFCIGRMQGMGIIHEKDEKLTAANDRNIEILEESLNLLAPLNK